MKKIEEDLQRNKGFEFVLALHCPHLLCSNTEHIDIVQNEESFYLTNDETGEKLKVRCCKECKEIVREIVDEEEKI